MPISLSIQVFQAGSSPSLQDKTVTPSTSTTTYSPNSGYDGFSSFTVNGDSNFIASNIKKGTTIWNITGTYNGLQGYKSFAQKITMDYDYQKYQLDLTGGNDSINEVYCITFCILTNDINNTLTSNYAYYEGFFMSNSITSSEMGTISFFGYMLDNEIRYSQEYSTGHYYIYRITDNRYLTIWDNDNYFFQKNITYFFYVIGK